VGGLALAHFTEMVEMGGPEQIQIPLAAVAVLQVLAAVLMAAAAVVVAALGLPEAFLGLTMAAAVAEQCPLVE
jgi:Ca2+/Na+ antiporter